MYLDAPVQDPLVWYTCLRPRLPQILKLRNSEFVLKIRCSNTSCLSWDAGVGSSGCSRCSTPTWRGASGADSVFLRFLSLTAFSPGIGGEKCRYPGLISWKSDTSIDFLADLSVGDFSRHNSGHTIYTAGPRNSRWRWGGSSRCTPVSGIPGNGSGEGRGFHLSSGTNWLGGWEGRVLLLVLYDNLYGPNISRYMKYQFWALP